MTVGVDPGLGALFSFEPRNPATREGVGVPIHMLTRDGKRKREVDIASLFCILALRRLKHAFVKQVGARPRPGGLRGFAFGKMLRRHPRGVGGAQCAGDLGSSGLLETGSQSA